MIRSPWGLQVGGVEKRATGKGNADKAAMVPSLRAMGFEQVDHNEADALALLTFAVEQATVDTPYGRTP